MAVRGDTGRETTSQIYDKKQIAAVLKALGIVIKGQTATDIQCLCPFHSNFHTPAFSISKTNGQWYCFNSSCNESGNLITLVSRINSLNEFEAMRYIQSVAGEVRTDVSEVLNDILADKGDDFETFPQSLVDTLVNNLVNNYAANEYLYNRGFTADTLKDFEVGYSDVQHLVTVPMRSSSGAIIGLIGRSTEGKVFKNSPGLPTSRTLFNIHRARQYSSVIITESAFDTMMVHQAGFPNVVGSIGSSMSETKLKQLDRYFNDIVIMTDFDSLKYYDPCKKCAGICKGHNAGRDLGHEIASNLSHKNILWAAYDYKIVYPHAAKDACDMTQEEIVTCITGAVPNYQYVTWNL